MTLIDVLAVLGPLAVYPLARPLVADGAPLPGPPASLGAALAFAGGFAAGTGAVPAVLTLPWLALALAALAAGIATWFRTPSFAFEAIAPLAGRAFLVVSAVFAVASRAQWSVAGVTEPIVELTCVHFAYAGFGAMVMARACARHPLVPRRRSAAALAIGTVAPPVVAAGFTFHLASFQIAGALLMTIFVWTVAFLTVRFALPDVPRAARALLSVSSIAIVAPMVLAVFWATAQYYDVPALSIDAMARMHGICNALGFVGCGLAGWRLVAAQADLRPAITARQRSGSASYGA